MTKLDPRTHVYRHDLAAISLRTRVTAGKYARPELARCREGRVPVYSKPDLTGQMISELRFGEFVDVYEAKGVVAWVQNRTDSYVGYIRLEALSDQVANPTHQVNVLRTFVYEDSDIKSAPLDILTLGSIVDVTDVGGKPENGGGMARISTGGWVCQAHLDPVGTVAPDLVATAGRMLGVPYLWGGRTPMGLDCSGLVQLVLNLCDRECPRDTDMQEAAFGQPLQSDWSDYDYVRGDLVFFPGHVGIMTGPTHLLHTNAHAMLVTVEPLIDVVARGAVITAVGRL